MKYKISAKSIGYLEKTIEADSEEHATSKLQKLLDNGIMPEIDGWIENEKVEKV